MPTTGSDLGFQPDHSDLGFVPDASGPQGSAASRFGGSLWDSTIGGIVNAVKRYGWEPGEKAKEAAQAGDWGEVLKEGLLASMPGANMASDIAKGSVQQAKQAYQQAQQGNYGQAAVSGIGAVPVVGPMIAKPAQQAMQGDYAGAAGSLVGTAATLGLPKVIPRGTAVTVLPETASLLDQPEAAAVQYGAREGVPMTPATQSGSPAVAYAQKLTQGQPGAAGVVKQAVTAQQQGLEQLGQRLSARVGTAATPESAGTATAAELTQRAADFAQQGRKAYQDLESMQADPANLKTVQTGTRTVTSPVLGPNGQPVTQTVPVTQQIAMPVDMRAAKAALTPVYDDLLKTMTVAQQQGSKGLLAIKNVVEGNDFESAATADQNLSAIKNIQREGVTPKSRYLAQKAADQLSPAIDQAVATGGPQATDALQTGRDMWKAKYATEETADNLQTEPVKLFNQLSAPKDVNINLLRDVASKAPDSMPAVGRAYLDGLMDTAFGDAGTGKPGTALTKWNNLGDSTKQILFPDPRLRADLDNFFTLAKRAGENPNPSGTAPTLALAADGGLLVKAPGLAVPYFIARPFVAKMMMSPGGARLLANGLKIPVSTPAASTLFANQIMRSAQALGAPNVSASSPGVSAGSPLPSAGASTP